MKKRKIIKGYVEWKSFPFIGMNIWIQFEKMKFFPSSQKVEGLKMKFNSFPPTYSDEGHIFLKSFNYNE